MKAIMNPAMIVTWLLGLFLVWQSGFYASGWMQAKFALVLAMSGCHGWFSRMVKDFAADRNARTHRFYRMVNEVPTLLMVAIVILIIVKPGFGS